MVELTVRLVASLAVVVGLLLLTVRLGARRFRPRAGAPLRIVHRQALSRSSSLAVVEVGSRVLVLGTTEHQINVLAELGQHELPGQAPAEQKHDELDDYDDYDDEVIDMEAVRRSGAFAVEPVSQSFVPSVPPTHTADHTSTPSPATGPLAGSVLSAETWRQAFAVATGRSR